MNILLKDKDFFIYIALELYKYVKHWKGKNNIWEHDKKYTRRK